MVQSRLQVPPLSASNSSRIEHRVPDSVAAWTCFRLEAGPRGTEAQAEAAALGRADRVGTGLAVRTRDCRRFTGFDSDAGISQHARKGVEIESAEVGQREPAVGEPEAEVGQRKAAVGTTEAEVG